MKRKYIKRTFILAVTLLAVLLLRSCNHIFLNTEQQKFTSPNGTNTIIIQYDFVSRPTIYKKGFLCNRKIWDYEGSGFMETVHFNVEWLSENQIRFSYDEFDEEYIITLD